MKTEIQQGNIVKSLSGHDAGRLYVVVIKVNKDFVLLADGTYRPLDNPKLKRLKHLGYRGESRIKEFTDAGIRKCLKAFAKETAVK